MAARTTAHQAWWRRAAVAREIEAIGRGYTGSHCGSHREHGWLDVRGVVRIYVLPRAAFLLILYGHLGDCSLL